MALWVRYEHAGALGFGTVEGGLVHVHSGDLLGEARPTGARLPLEAVRIRTPVEPSQFVCLVTNSRAAAAKQGQPVPAEPLWFLKSRSAWRAHGEPIPLPRQDVGKVTYEGELGIVIGREARDVDEADADRHVLGYTCVNDVTALDLIGRDPSYAQWSRAKGFDGFGPFGPFVATGIDADRLVVRTLVNGKVRQEYPTTDLVFSPRALVSRLSRDLVLRPGDLIACGTSLGIGVLRAGARVEVAIEGVGTLSNPVVGPEGA